MTNKQTHNDAMTAHSAISFDEWACIPRTLTSDMHGGYGAGGRKYDVVPSTDVEARLATLNAGHWSLYPATARREANFPSKDEALVYVKAIWQAGLAARGLADWQIQKGRVA